jgi:hypothetical protein
MADLVERHGYDALVRAMGVLPPLPLLAAGGWTAAVPPAIAPDLLPAVFRGAAATDAPEPETVAAIRQPVLLRPWIDDPAHPLSTAELLHDLLPGSALEVMATPDDVRALGGRLVEFFG